jgi:hypothetical protein
MTTGPSLKELQIFCDLMRTKAEMPSLKQDAERYRLIHARFAAMTPAQQQDFLGLLRISYTGVDPLSEYIDIALSLETL